MSIALDPSEMRAPVEGRAPGTPKAPSRVGRLALMTVLGGVGLVGLSAGAYSMLSGLAGPPPSKVRMGRVSADWPDLRDGVPALAPSHRPSSPVPVPAAIEAAVPDPAPLKAVSAPVEAKPAQVASVAPAAKPARLPVIENAATVPAAPAVALVEKARTAPLVAPTPIETTRARTTTGGTFAALPPAPALSEAAPKPKAAPVVARTKPAAKPAPATAEKVAAAQPAQASEPEVEETEMFGMKVPSLAPVGRKLVEGVEAFGNAVKRFPEQF
ncbi:hypothetical protein [Methylobacterium sp. J-090]|uniref:hypothetical protein n=1 Tax=Methylobacterium sp. J-090 TaxID=2836666 RepID=UPI001FBBBB27|nr:hypothetical protein [Methylobacterium sp. J-090]MCJ2083059.1 hypothetical protein [Methylobacterium sp. J-090]